jgi:hypothetical protein
MRRYTIEIQLACGAIECIFMRQGATMNDARSRLALALKENPDCNIRIVTT